MKPTILLIFTLFLLASCSRENGFSKFDFSNVQERGANSIQNSRIIKENKTYAIISSLYLNEIYPKRYANEHHFLVIISGANLPKPEFFLNGAKALSSEKLSKETFGDIIVSESEWSSRYHVVFSASSKPLHLQVEIDQLRSAALNYLVEPQ